MPTLGVVIFSLQGMKHLPQCLESVRWADLVLVLHAGAGKPAIGETRIPSLLVRNFASRGDVARLEEDVKTDWLLHLWGEERVEEELAAELREFLKSSSPHAATTYRIPIRSYLLGRWVKGSLLEPSPAARLTRKSGEIPLGWWDAATMNARPAATFSRGWIGDYGSSQLSDAIDYIQNLSDLWAEGLQSADRGPGPLTTVLCSGRVFMRLLFGNGVFAGGLAGLTLSLLAAYSILLSGAKRWEAKHVRERVKT